MNRTLKIGSGIAIGAAAVAVAGMMATASPVATSLTAADPSPTATADAQQDAPRVAETPLTGDNAAKAKAAAEAAVPGGTIIRVETDSDGGATYEAHVTRSDGTEVVVKLDKDFAVTSVDAFGGGGRHGGGHGGGPGMGETPLTGDDATKATAAAEAAVSGGTVIRVETDSDGTYEAHVRKSDGTEVEVKMDSNFTVTSVEEFQGRGPGADDADDDSSATATPSA
jgi:uncharacterized membrane protein YkoI